MSNTYDETLARRIASLFLYSCFTQEAAFAYLQAIGADMGQLGGGGAPPSPLGSAGPVAPRPPWREADGSLVGRRGSKSMIRIMPGSSSPKAAVRQFVDDTDDYMAAIGEKPLGNRRETTVSGDPFMIRSYSDGTFLSLRDSAASSDATPSGWWSLDISRNPDIIGSNGKMPLKLKFPD